MPCATGSSGEARSSFSAAPSPSDRRAAAQRSHVPFITSIPLSLALPPSLVLRFPLGGVLRTAGFGLSLGLLARPCGKAEPQFGVLLPLPDLLLGRRRGRRDEVGGKIERRAQRLLDPVGHSASDTACQFRRTVELGGGRAEMDHTRSLARRSGLSPRYFLRCPLRLRGARVRRFGC